MLQNTVLKDTFGRHFVVKSRRQNSCQISLQPLKFSDESRAFSFISQLRTPHGYWRNALYSIEKDNLSSFHCKSTSGCNTPEHLISKYLSGFARCLYIYELVDYKASQSNQSQRRFEQSNGDQYIFNHASAQLLSGTPQSVALGSQSAISKLLRELPCDEQRLKLLAESLNLNKANAVGAGGAKNRELIIGAILAGEVIVSFQPKPSRPPKTLELLEPAAADWPYQQPSDMGSGASYAPSAAAKAEAARAAEPVNRLETKSQAGALEKAAEEGVPFCKECEKAKAARAASQAS